jgi:monothiol glutaredoxin
MRLLSESYSLDDIFSVINRKWPTIPQLYLDGELVGGADILLQLHQNGSLIDELKKIGHTSLLAETKQ